MNIPPAPSPNPRRLFKHLRRLCDEYIAVLNLGELQSLHDQLQRQWRERQHPRKEP